MTPEKFKRAKEVFSEACDLNTDSQVAFLQ